MARRASGGDGPPKVAAVSGADRVWPVGLTLMLLIVVLVNVGFIVLAVRGQDEVARSYVEGER